MISIAGEEYDVTSKGMHRIQCRSLCGALISSGTTIGHLRHRLEISTQAKKGNLRKYKYINIKQIEKHDMIERAINHRSHMDKL